MVSIVGDDQHELFNSSNQPAIAIGWVEQLATGCSTSPPSPLNDQIKLGYAMDVATVFPGQPDLAKALISGQMEQGFDVASAAGGAPVEGGHTGYGPAYGFVLKRLLGDRTIPVVPILLNRLA